MRTGPQPPSPCSLVLASVLAVAQKGSLSELARIQKILVSKIILNLSDAMIEAKDMIKIKALTPISQKVF